MFRSIAKAATRQTQNNGWKNIALRHQAMNKNEFAGIRFLSTENGDETPSAKVTGVVKWFDSKKGFGFIIPNDGSDDVFVHHSAIHSQGFRSLADGEDVEFTVVDNDGRRNAADVTGPDGDYVQGKTFPPRREYYDDNSSGDRY